jgi:hypothetical protein
MRRALVAMAACVFAAAPAARATTLSPDAAYIRDCLTAAGNAYHEPPAVLVILLNVEGGRLGAVSANTNSTVDIGPMQVNNIWLPKLAARWATNRQAAYLALRDNFCANVEAGAWILRMGLDEAHGDFWEGVGFYHSHDPDYRRTYLSAVLKQAMRLESQARATTETIAPSSSGPREAPVHAHAAPVSVASRARP